MRIYASLKDWSYVVELCLFDYLLILLLQFLRPQDQSSVLGYAAVNTWNQTLEYQINQIITVFLISLEIYKREKNQKLQNGRLK